MAYDGKKSTDMWYPVLLLDEIDFKTPETGKVYGDVTVKYEAVSATSQSTYTVGSGDWTEAGNGEYSLRIGASEFTAETKYQVSVACSGCLTHRFVVEVTDKTKAEMIDDIDTLLSRIPSALSISGGIVESNLKQINSNSVTGNAATLTLKQLDIQNSAGSAVIAKSTGGNGSGFVVEGNGSGHGVSITAGATGDALLITTGCAGTGSAIRAISEGNDAVSFESWGGNGNGLNLSGNGSGNGLNSVGGATGMGGFFSGGATSGAGLMAVGQGNDSAFYGTCSNAGSGLKLEGGSSGNGITITAGGTGNGIDIIAGSSSGDGIQITTTDGHGIGIDANGSGKNGIHSVSASSVGIRANGGTYDFQGNIAGSVTSVTGAVGSVTGAVGSVTGNVGGNVTGSVGSVVAGVDLADDAITASKFDETTAYPLTSADTGSTQVARTGADGDTLETLSDQVDGVQTSVDGIQNNTRFVATVPTSMLVPDTGTTMYKITAHFYDTDGNPEDPDSDEIDVLYEDVTGADKDAFYDDSAGTTPATAGTIDANMWQMVRISTGVYETYYKLPNTESVAQWIATFKLEEATTLLNYARSTNVVEENPGSTTLADNATNKDIIAEALKERDVSGTGAVSGSIYKDIQDNIDANETKIDIVDGNVDSIVAKLPSKAYLAGSDNSDGDVELDDATGALPAGAFTNHPDVDLNADQSGVTIGTCTTNTDMRGTDNALLAASAPANFGDLSITATTGKVTVGTNDDKTGYSISGTKTTLDALNDISTSDVDTALSDIGLDHLLAVAVSGGDVTDDSIIAQMVSKSGTADWDSFDNTTDSLEAIRDRGDAAWTSAVVGTVDANVVQIDGQATNGNNATLNLKQLNVVNSTGDAIVASSTGGNGNGINASGNSSGAGFKATGGSTGDGIKALAGSSGNGSGIYAENPNSDPCATGHGIYSKAAGSGHGLFAVGGSEGGHGGYFYGLGSGSGIYATTASSGHGIFAEVSSGPGHAIYAVNDSSGSAIKADGETGGGYDIEANIQGNLSGSVGSVTGNVGGNVAGSVGSVTGAVTVGTNNDKTGYSISGSITTLDGLNNLSAAQVNAEVDTALSDIGLDHLVGVAVSGSDIADNSIIAQMVSKSATADWDSYDNTTDSLEALADGVAGVADWTSGEKEQIRDALGIDGTKTTATGGQLQDKSELTGADVQLECEDAIDAKFTFNGTNVNANAKEISDSSAAADSVESNIGNLDAAISTRSTFDRTTESVIVGTNNDKTGYSIAGTKQTLDALNDISLASVTAEIETGLATTTRPEKSVGQPAAVDSIAGMLTRMYGALVFEGEQSAGTPGWKTFHNSTGVPIWKKEVSDDGTTYEEKRGVSA